MPHYEIDKKGDDYRHLVIFQPSGKISGDKLVTQQPQKGHTCFFYAMRQLRFEGHYADDDPRRTAERQLSSGRKALTELDKHLDQRLAHIATHPSWNPQTKKKRKSQAQRNYYREKVHLYWQTLHAMLGYNIWTRISQDFSFQYYNKTSSGNVIDDWSNMSYQQKNLVLNSIFYQYSAEVYGLKNISWNPSQGIDGLAKTLAQEGSFVATGRFGSSHYTMAPTLRQERCGSRSVYGWQASAFRPECTSHVVVVIGVKKSRFGDFVYFTDPADASDPTKPFHRSTYRIPYHTFIDHLLSNEGARVSEADKQGMENFSFGYYQNPADLSAHAKQVITQQYQQFTR